MKLLSCALLLMASMAFVLLGCSETVAPATSVNDLATTSVSSPPQTLAKGAAVAGSAQGGGAIETPDPSTMFTSVKFGFTALSYSNGSCGGQVEMDLVGVDKSLVKKIHGTVKGVKFYGNVAMFWAELRTDFAVDWFGEVTWKQIFVVTDNGEGKNAVPDRMSNPWLTSEDLWEEEFDTFWAMSAEEFLASIPGSIGTPPDYPLARGNIQVRER